MSKAFSVSEPDWNQIEPANITQAPYLENSDILIVPTQFGQLRLSISNFGLRIQSADDSQATYGMLTATPEKETLELSGSDTHFTLTGGSYRLELFTSPLHFKLFKNDRLVQQSATDGHFVRQHRLPPFAKTDAVWASSRMNNIAQHFTTAWLGKYLKKNAEMHDYLDLVPSSNDGKWAKDKNGAENPEHTHWKGFENRTAKGLKFEWLKPQN